jgi:hypothetical protein
MESSEHIVSIIWAPAILNAPSTKLSKRALELLTKLPTTS